MIILNTWRETIEHLQNDPVNVEAPKFPVSLTAEDNVKSTLRTLMLSLNSPSGISRQYSLRVESTCFSFLHSAWPTLRNLGRKWTSHLPPGLRPDQTESRSRTRKSEKRTLGLIETEGRRNASEQILTVGRAVSQNSPNGPELTCSSYWVVTQHVVTQEQPTHRGVSSDPSAGLVRGTILEPFWLNFYCCRTNRSCGSSVRFFTCKFWQWLCFSPRVPRKNLQTQTTPFQSNYFCITTESGQKETLPSAQVRAVLMQQCLTMQTRQVEGEKWLTNVNLLMNDTQIDVIVFNQIFKACFCFLAC